MIAAMRRFASLLCICLVAFLTEGAASRPGDIAWKVIGPGVEFASFRNVYLLRVDPAIAKLTVGLASETHSGARTAAEWCRSAHLVAAINVGMFQNDHLSNVGYLRHGSHVNNPRWNHDNAVLALDASHALWIDRDRGDIPSLAKYDIVVQNLRLITKDRRNVWAASKRRWSEAALAIDGKGRLLFVFSRAPWTMRDFNQFLVALPLDIAGAMHLEGGPEASLSVHAPGIDLDLAGSFETGFWPDDSNVKQWPIPNVLGVSSELETK